MDEVAKLSVSQCILLAAALASEGNSKGLGKLVSIKSPLFDLELTCRIILTFLPESLDPSSYLGLLHQITSPGGDENTDSVLIDVTAVQEFSETEARKQLRSLRLLPLRHPSTPTDVECDTFSLFLIHRAHRIDSETGLLPLAPKLISPFLDRSDYLCDWYVGNCVPLLRLDYDYYPAEEPSYSLDTFQVLDGSDAIPSLLSKTKQSALDGSATADTVGRDLRGILGPFVQARHLMRGRKRKREESEGYIQELPPPLANDPPREWWQVNDWLLAAASSNFVLVEDAFKGWSGPVDMDLGLPEELYPSYQLNAQAAETARRNLCQTALASIYAAEQDGPEILDGVHAILVRTATQLGLDAPLDLAISIDMLPSFTNRTQLLDSSLLPFLQNEALLQPSNPLTEPGPDQFCLLQMLMYSAYLLNGLDHVTSIAKLAKFRFSSEDDEQLRLVQRILDNVVLNQKQNDRQWQATRRMMLWLWEWSTLEQPELLSEGYGLFGKIGRSVLETELLKALCAAGHYDLVGTIYLNESIAVPPLPRNEAEKVIVALALSYFDNASNGNKTRGGVKKALDVLNAFRSYFSRSPSFKRCNNLIAATHALSFYSLKLQPEVPLKPATIRTLEDPLTLVEKVLEQNTNAYTKLDDLIEIGCNLVKASYSSREAGGALVNNTSAISEFDEATELLIAERRVISLAIESALNFNDFETAYSYVVNRLQSPISSSKDGSSTSVLEDDISWRAALHAGRYRSSSSTTSKTSTPPHIRGLEQRMELLSHALQLAPPPNLPEVLAAWRRVEEELLAVVARESEAEQAFDDQADRGQVRTALGSLGGSLDIGSGNSFAAQHKRKDFGKGAAAEAPMGLFDVARGAAAAFGRSTSGSLSASRLSSRAGSGAYDSTETSGRQRKRDMVANVVTGGLASGLGWVLGATPAKDGSA